MVITIKLMAISLVNILVPFSDNYIQMDDAEMPRKPKCVEREWKIKT